MTDQKMDNLLNLSLDATEEEREKSLSLNVGFDEETRLWDVIVKYSGPAEGLQLEGIQVVPLLGEYAVVTLPQARLDELSDLSQVEFIEKPKRLFFSVFDAITESCIRSVQPGGSVFPGEGLTGRGILVGIVDSGVDYRHPDFRNPDGTTRILCLWDQTAVARNSSSLQETPIFIDTPPQGYALGVEYTRERINAALALSAEEGYGIVPQRDLSGHGTAALGIAAGNGRASNGVYRGIAYESEILAVKLGIPREDSFPRTTELIQAVDYLVRTARDMGRPIAINLSFGNNYGSHEPYH
ncbi:MAG: S8 family serine peptidase [Blautia sp.]|nr:S8 family serine peptidase [Blautia sp.]